MRVNNIDPIRVKEKLKKSECDLCTEALECIEAFERVVDISQETNKKAIRKIKSQSKELREFKND